jgi:probable HAF family extracellular repeat protein
MRPLRVRSWFPATGVVAIVATIGLISSTPATADAVPAGSTTYVADFVSTAAFGVAMNDAGDVIGTSYRDTGCGSFCLPPLDTVVWRGGERIVLPDVPGLSGITVRDINNDGWVVGFAGFPSTTTHAVVWKPNGNTYQAIDIGSLPGTTASDATAIDNLGRVVGWSTTLNFPPQGSPFMWTEAGGMVDLSAQGFPDQQPLAMSPGGTVATADAWYRLGDSGSVTAMPPAPPSFSIGTEPTGINDAGDQARFLISTGAENLRYLFRFHHTGTWQQISFLGIKNVTYGVGSVSDA